MTQKTNPLVQLLEVTIEGRMSSFIMNFFLIPAFLAMVLLLPPISIYDRLVSIGYTRIGYEGGSLQNARDGMEVHFLPEGVGQPFRASLSAISRSSFLEGSAGNSLVVAAETIPPNLIMRSPFYRIQWRGSMPEAVLLIVPIPREAETPHTLDLYAWNGQDWEWLPNEKFLSEGVIESNLDYLPRSVVVMETHPVNPSVSTDYQANTPLPDSMRDTLVEINPEGLYLDVGGRIFGSLENLPPEVRDSSLVVVPTLRNWYEDGSVRSDLIDNLLVEEISQERHVKAIVDFIHRNAFQGIDLDFRDISPDLRDEYVRFLM
jgi:hypothetical protein